MLPLLLFANCNKAPVAVAPQESFESPLPDSPAKSVLKGVLQERFLPNPVNGGGAPISVTPLADEEVLAFDAAEDGRQKGAAKTNSQGQFSMELPPGDYRVVFKSRYSERDVSTKVTLVPGKETTTVLESVLAPP